MAVPLLVVTDAVVDRLAAAGGGGLPPRLFDALAAARRATRALCGRCGRLQRREEVLGPAYAAIRAALVNLAQDPAGAATLAGIKATLGADRLRVVAGTTAGGTPVRWTF